MEMLINREFPKRPEKNKLDELKSIGSVTISAELKHLAGIEDSFMLVQKPVTRVNPLLVLQSLFNSTATPCLVQRL